MQATLTPFTSSRQSLGVQQASAEANRQVSPKKRDNVEAEEKAKRTASSGRSRREKAAAAQGKSSHTPLFQNNPALANLQRKDSVSISNGGRMLQVIERLQAHKESLLEQKNAMVEKIIESGRSLEDIEDPLEAIDEQITAIDEQISELMNQQAQVQLTKKEEETASKEKSSSPETEDELERQRIGELSNLSAVSNFSGNVMKAAQRVEGEARARKGELESDKLGIENRQTRLKIRRAEQKLESGKAADSSVETQHYRQVRSAYSKQIRAVENEALNRLDEITNLAAAQNGEVQRSLNNDPEAANTRPEDSLEGFRQQPFEARA